MSPFGLVCFSVMVAGSGRLLVVSVIQASVQLTSSSLNLLSGGSAVSQDMQQIRSRAIMKNKKLNCEFKFFPFKKSQPLNNKLHS